MPCVPEKALFRHLPTVLGILSSVIRSLLPRRFVPRLLSLGLLSLVCSLPSEASAQTLYVPSGTSGIGASSNGNVGIGTNAPRSALEVLGGSTSTFSTQTIGLWNVALAATVTTSGGTLEGGGPTKRSANSVWTATATGQWIMFDLGAAPYVVVAGVGFGTYWRLDNRFTPAGYVIDVSADGSSWTNYATVTGNTELSVMHYGGGYWRYVRLTVTAFQPGYSAANITGVQILTDTRAARSGEELWGLNINTDAVFLTGNGNVGIGTPAPSGKLEVRSSGSGLFQYWTASDGSILGDFREEADGSGIFTVRDMNATVKALIDSDGVSFLSGGNVGIGTMNPQARLDVDGGVEPLFVRNGGSSRLFFGVNQSGGGYGRIGVFDDSQPGWRNLILAEGGNVGIGTTNPSHKLAVNGTIKAKEVIVETTGWSDYVFDESYRLAPLSEVETHIREKKHLPGIPSAAEVEQGGVSLGDMQARLLAKIEELTLHVIGQQKELAAQRAALETQSAEIAGLRQQLSAVQNR